jgi:hypothetical protein
MLAQKVLVMEFMRGPGNIRNIYAAGTSSRRNRETPDSNTANAVAQFG